MKSSFIKKVLDHGDLDTKKYRYIVRHKNDLYHQFPTIERLQLSLLRTTAALTEWEEVWSGRDSLRYWPDGWYNVEGRDVLVEDGIVLRGTKRDINGGDITAYVYKSDGHGGYDQISPTIVEFIEKGYSLQ